MLSKIYTMTITGLKACLITVETNISRGLPHYNVVGLGDSVIREAGSRIRAAILNSDLEYPMSRIDVNLSPASSKKKEVTLICLWHWEYWHHPVKSNLIPIRFFLENCQWMGR